jgi:hypothetical protein
MATAEDTADPDDALQMQITVHRVPASGLYIANVSVPRPMIVKGYRLVEVLNEIWNMLTVDGHFGRISSNIVVNSRHRHEREDNDRMSAEMTQFAIALQRMIEPRHPAGSPENLDQVRDIAKAAFDNARRVGRERRTAWGEGALAQTSAGEDRDLLQALCGAAMQFLKLLPLPASAAGSHPQPTEAADGLTEARERLVAVLAAVEAAI